MEAFGDAVVPGEPPHGRDLLPPGREYFGLYSGQLAISEPSEDFYKSFGYFGGLAVAEAFTCHDTRKFTINLPGADGTFYVPSTFELKNPNVKSVAGQLINKREIESLDSEDLVALVSDFVHADLRQLFRLNLDYDVFRSVIAGTRIDRLLIWA